MDYVILWSALGTCGEEGWDIVSSKDDLLYLCEQYSNPSKFSLRIIPIQKNSVLSLNELKLLLKLDLEG